MTWKTGTSKTKFNPDGTPKEYAFWSCPKKNNDGSFCNAKPQQPNAPKAPQSNVNADALTTILKYLVEINRKLSLLLPEEKPLPKRVPEPEIPVVEPEPVVYDDSIPF
jgi:hypothetical protein